MIKCLSVVFMSSVLCATGGHAQATKPVLRHFIFFGGERHRIMDSAFVANPNIAGAQVKYTWRDLEPQRDRYDLSQISADIAALARHHKRLWVQLQDVAFMRGNRVVPDYLVDDPAFGGGVADQYENDDGELHFAGQMARRWDPAVRDRFARLLDTLGRAFDGKIEGLNFAETSFSTVSIDSLRPRGFTAEGYARAIRAMMTSGRTVFRHSHVMVYGNFMPGEWLPGNDHGYLRGVYRLADSVGVAVGGPDLLPFRKGQQNHALALIPRRGTNTIAGLAVQDGNLAETNPLTGKRVTVEELARYATDQLRLDYLFWGTEEPYYSSAILPWLGALRR